MTNTNANPAGVADTSTTVKLKTRLYELTNENTANDSDAKGERITLLWCDGSMDEEPFTNDVTYTKTMLHDLSSFVHYCSSEAECIAYLATFLKNETILVVVSGALASKTLLDTANTIRRVDTIFIFCMEEKKFEALAQHPKVAGIFHEQESLKYSIMKTMRAIERQAAILQLYDPTKQRLARNLDRETGSFVWLQLIKEAIQKMCATVPNTTSEDSNGKQEMLH
ncbi:unnamed protein product, partial [Didymodactylos carnosus]